MLTVKFLLHELLFSLGIDTGASVTLLSESAYSTLKLKFANLPLELQKSNVTLSSVQGSTLLVTGLLTCNLLVTLPISLASDSKIFNVQFYVTPQFALPSDGLLGLDSHCAHDIQVHPKKRAIFSDQRFYSAMDVNFPLLSSVASTSVTKQGHATSASPAQCLALRRRNVRPLSRGQSLMLSLVTNTLVFHVLPDSQCV